MAGFNDRLNLGMQPMNIQDPELKEQMRMAQAPIEGEAPVQPQEEALVQTAAPRPKKMFDDPRYQEAVDHQKKQQRYADILRNFQSIVSAGTGAQANMTVADAIEKRAGQPLEEYNFRMQQEDKARKEGIEDERFGMDKEKHNQSTEMHKLDLKSKQASVDKVLADSQQEKLTANPTSEISQYTQDKYIEISKKLGRPYNEASVRRMSAKQLHNYEPGIQDHLKNLWDEKKALETRAATEKQDQINHTQAKELKQIEIDGTAKKLEAAEKKADKKVASENDKLIWKENRKVLTKVNEALPTLKDQLANVKRVREAYKTYEENRIGGSGPISTLGGLTTIVNAGDEKMDGEFARLSLKNLTEMFSGMSKAVDTGAERAAFEATQAGIKRDSPANYQTLDVMEEALTKMIAKTEAAQKRYTREGKFADEEPADEVYAKTSTEKQKIAVGFTDPESGLTFQGGAVNDQNNWK